jgi:hypothetical protein
MKNFLMSILSYKKTINVNEEEKGVFLKEFGHWTNESESILQIVVNQSQLESQPDKELAEVIQLKKEKPIVSIKDVA